MRPHLSFSYSPSGASLGVILFIFSCVLFELFARLVLEVEEGVEGEGWVFVSAVSYKSWEWSNFNLPFFGCDARAEGRNVFSERNGKRQCLPVRSRRLVHCRAERPQETYSTSDKGHMQESLDMLGLVFKPCVPPPKQRPLTSNHARHHSPSTSTGRERARALHTAAL